MLFFMNQSFVNANIIHDLKAFPPPAFKMAAS